MARLGGPVSGGRAGCRRDGASTGTVSGRGSARRDDGRRAALCGGAQCISPRQDRRVATEDWRVAAEGNGRGLVTAGAERLRPTNGCTGRRASTICVPLGVTAPRR